MEQESNATEQPVVDSVEDRVGRLLGEQTEAEPEAVTAEEQTEPETFEFEYEGTKHTLPKQLEKALMQERDYTQKSQQLAERNKDYDR